MAITILVILCAALIAWWLYGDQWLARYYKRRERPLTAGQRRQLARDMPLYARLPSPMREKLEGLMMAFLSRVDFVGCEGLRVNSRMRLLVAAQACLLLLGRDEPAYPNVHTLYLYPEGYINAAPQRLAGGVIDPNGRHLAGESWHDGRVVLSWNDCLYSAAYPFDGTNLVIHEFAHQLDQAKGSATGAPLQGSLPQAKRWQAVFQAAFDRHCLAVARGEHGLIDPYGATNPAEFFAVVSEVFFERGLELAEAEPQMYEMLSAFYGLDTRHWA
ncbi:zinc-dependent peptidase [Gallaecimonas kandeliae]|uniref:M90 family metallopeptidase n=1 Tax=Gallaecimonas kandeliae TaxID=3029055 RepID=UPI0026488A1E|nr:M90 family metallopeptidase [Gallaecimonas kandeliae]WKE66811.1 zinc-dependent peptidase [Gallaecimonas kandeliae]